MMSENIRFFLDDKYTLDENTKKILQQMAVAEGVARPIAVLPDIHYKLSYHTPTGVVVLTKDKIISKFVNANCGMCFAITPFFADDIDEERMDGIFDYLRENISISTRTTPIISKKDLKDIVKNGAVWTFENYRLNPKDLLNFENNGSLFKDSKMSIEEIMSFIPETCQRVGLLSLGVLGYGNHFIELQVIDEIKNKEISERFGISKGQLCFMIHADSRAFGQSIWDFYSKKTKKLFGLQQVYKKLHYRIASSDRTSLLLKRSVEFLNFYINRMKSTIYWRMDRLNKKEGLKFKTIEVGSREADAYINSTYSAINYGHANRAYLVSVIRDALKKSFEAKTVNIRILHDGNHDVLQKEAIDGENFYVHRNGATRALPPKYFPNHPIFSKTGQPVLLPSSLGRPSFLCAATKGCPGSYYSSCHGAGRLFDRGEARHRFKTEEVFREVQASNMKVYDYGKGHASEESPHAFKNVEDVLTTIIKYNIAEPVARLKPLAALKGWR